MSHDQYRIAWTDYQSLLVNKLNELTAGEPYEHTQPKDIAIQFARDPHAASLFNHASMAHNNHLFFLKLSTDPQPLKDNPTLHQSLTQSFGSIETLKATMLDRATAMFGPGFVWLVWARERDPSRSSGRKGSWKILNTYLAGTPYPEAGYRQQGVDTNTMDAASYAQHMKNQPTNYAGAFGGLSKNAKETAKLPPGGTNVMPVLCVNTWEHCWLRDFGMNGKRAYLNAWWEAVDWGAVSTVMPAEAQPAPAFSRSSDKYF